MLSRELKAGIVVLLAGVVLYFGISYLKNSSLFDKGITVYSVYERVDGLMGSQPVTINGYAVGRIESIGFHPDHSGKLVVAMRIESDYPIPVTSLALIKSSDLLGAKEISLQIGEGSVLIEDGDTLRSAIEESLGDAINKEVLPVKVKTEKLIASLDNRGADFNRVPARGRGTGLPLVLQQRQPVAHSPERDHHRAFELHGPKPRVAWSRNAEF